MMRIKLNRNIIVVMLSLLLTLSSIILLQMIFALLTYIGFHIRTDSLLSNVILEVVILIVQIPIVWKNSKENLISSLGFPADKNRFEHVFTGICAGFAIFVLMYSAVFGMKFAVFEGIGFTFYSSKIVLVTVLSVFTRAVFAGISEEVFFRGVLLRYLAKYKGNLFGLAISSIIFAVFHTSRYQDLNQLFSVLVCGTVLGYLYIMTKSLYVSVGLHAATDFFIPLAGTKSEAGLFILSVKNNFSEEYLYQRMFTLLTVLYLVLFFVFLLVNKRKTGKYGCPL